MWAWAFTMNGICKLVRRWKTTYYSKNYSALPTLTPVEFGSGNQHLLSQPLSHWNLGGRDSNSFRYLWNASELWIFQAQRMMCCCRLPRCLQGKRRKMETHCCWLLLSSSRKDVAR